MLTRDRAWHTVHPHQRANLDRFVDGVNATKAQLTYIELRRRATVAAGAS